MESAVLSIELTYLSKTTNIAERNCCYICTCFCFYLKMLYNIDRFEGWIRSKNNILSILCTLNLLWNTRKRMNSWVETTNASVQQAQLLLEMWKEGQAALLLCLVCYLYLDKTVLAFNSAHMMHLDEIFCLDIIFLYCSK